jgi:signal peptidase I
MQIWSALRRSVRNPALGKALAVASILGGVSLFTGCTSVRTEAEAAPRSSISRQNALSLAHITARTVNGQVFAVAATGSMKPTLDENSVVTVERVAFSKLRRGDIIIYLNSHGQAIIHRLYEQHGSSWFVLGDNNGSVDAEAVTSSNFQGRVCAIFYTSSSGMPSNDDALAERDDAR